VTEKKPEPVFAPSSSGKSKWGALKEGVKEPGTGGGTMNAIQRAQLVKEEAKPKSADKYSEIDIVKPTGGGDSFTARIKAAQAAKASSR
jgi:hypothetical protein